MEVRFEGEYDGRAERGGWWYIKATFENDKLAELNGGKSFFKRQVSPQSKYGLRSVVEKSLQLLGLKFKRVGEGANHEIMSIPELD